MRRILHALAFSLFVPALALAAAKPIVLSGNEKLANHATIAVQGDHAIVAWSGLREGHYRLFVRQREGASWSPIIEGPAMLGECGETVVAFGRDGLPAVAWTMHSGPSSTLYFHSFTNGTTFSAPQRVARVGNNARVQSPSLVFDNAGRPVVAWSEGGGGQFQVAYARRPHASAGFVRMPVSPAPDSYDILPTLLPGAAPRLYWYTLKGTDFQLRGATLSPDGWRSIDVPSAVAVPARRLPLLFNTASAMPGAVWLEPSPEGDARLRCSGCDTKLPFEVAPAGPRIDPDAAQIPGTPGVTLAWSEPSAVILGRGSHVVRLEGLDHPVAPRIAGWGPMTDVVFTSSADAGGTGRVYWASVPLGE